MLHEAEVQHLDEVVIEPAAAGENIRGLHVAVHEPARVRIRQGMASLPQQMDSALGRHLAEALDQGTEIETVQKLHDVVERPILGDAEVVDFDRMR
jgi:hypothetical protein